jgi:hypothetical protein
MGVARIIFKASFTGWGTTAGIFAYKITSRLIQLIAP